MRVCVCMCRRGEGRGWECIPQISSTFFIPLFYPSKQKKNKIKESEHLVISNLKPIIHSASYFIGFTLSVLAALCIDYINLQRPILPHFPRRRLFLKYCRWAA